MGVADEVESVLLDADSWMRIETENEQRGERYVLGLDLGSSAAMSAAAAYWPETHGLECFAVFPLEPSLAERGGGRRRRGACTLRCAERGELLQAGDRVSDIRALLTEVRARWGVPAAIVCDRWREQELRAVAQRGAVPSDPVDHSRHGLSGRRRGREGIPASRTGRPSEAAQEPATAIRYGGGEGDNRSRR